MIWVGAVLGGIVLALTTSQSWAWIAGVATLNAFLIPVFTPLIGPLGVNGPAWSLFYECVANLIYATFWRYLHRRALVLLVAVCGAAVPVVAIHYGRMNVGWELATIPAALTRVGFSFFLGVLLCRTRATWSRYLPTLNAWLVLAGVAMLLFVPCPRALRPIYDTLFIWFGSPLLIMLGAKTEPAAGHRRWFENLALLSYPLYAIHHPVRDIVQNLAIRTGVPTGPVAILTWLLLIPASLLIARVYETPVRRWLHRLRRAKPRSAPPQAAI